MPSPLFLAPSSSIPGPGIVLSVCACVLSGVPILVEGCALNSEDLQGGG